MGSKAQGHESDWDGEELEGRDVQFLAKERSENIAPNLILGKDVVLTF